MNGKNLPDMDLLVTNLTCERGSQAHRPNKTLSGTNDSEQDTESAPGNIIPKTSIKNQRATLDDVSYQKVNFYIVNLQFLTWIMQLQ